MNSRPAKPFVIPNRAEGPVRNLISADSAVAADGSRFLPSVGMTNFFPIAFS